MKFCSVCDNMLYIDVRDNGSMQWFCHFCEQPDEVENQKNDSRSLLISTMNYNNERSKYKHLMTPEIHRDPTIPRVSNIECINPKCTRKPKETQEVRFVKYDEDNLRYIYSCSYCRHYWVTGSKEIFAP